MLRQLRSEAPALGRSLPAARHPRCATRIATSSCAKLPRGTQHAFAAPRRQVRRIWALQAAWHLLGSC